MLMLMTRLQNTHTHTHIKYKYTHRNTHSLFTTLSEAGVKGPRPFQIKAIRDRLQAQVEHLVEAELTAVDGRSFGLQCDEELLRTVAGHQTSLEDTRQTERVRNIEGHFEIPKGLKKGTLDMAALDKGHPQKHPSCFLTCM